MTRIGIILGSTRPHRTGEHVARWVLDQAKQRSDDLPSAKPWTPRYLRVYGTAELVERAGQFGPVHDLRSAPTLPWSFDLEGIPFNHDREVRVQRTVHKPPAGGVRRKS